MRRWSGVSKNQQQFRDVFNGWVGGFFRSFRNVCPAKNLLTSWVFFSSLNMQGVETFDEARCAIIRIVCIIYIYIYIHIYIYILLYCVSEPIRTTSLRWESCSCMLPFKTFIPVPAPRPAGRNQWRCHFEGLALFIFTHSGETSHLHQWSLLPTYLFYTGYRTSQAATIGNLPGDEAGAMDLDLATFVEGGHDMHACMHLYSPWLLFFCCRISRVISESTHIWSAQESFGGAEVPQAWILRKNSSLLSRLLLRSCH